jgi:peptide-methionine (S)-S-oxide reductase
MLFSRKKTELPTADTALPGRSTPILGPIAHDIYGRPLHGPFPAGTESILFGLGCFWGAERKFWQLDPAGDRGLWITAVGYAGGFTPNPTYEEVCSGHTGHNEVVLVVFEPVRLPLSDLLKAFWENHDPTQGMRQGNDIGTQYRSGIYTRTDAQRQAAEASRAAYQPLLSARGFGPITTEILAAPPFYYAEDYHQQYLSKVPHGYCGLGGTGVSCPIGTGIAPPRA